MRTVVWTGSRGWQDEDTVIDAVTSIRKPFRSICGGADGFDTVVWDVLTGFGLPRLLFKAKWKLHGRAAGHVRNDVMLDWLQALDPDGFVLAGWDGSSKGTKGCMDKAAKRGIPVWRLMYVPSLNKG